MIQIQVQTNDAAFSAGLAQLRARMGNLRVVMGSIGAELESRIAARFETGRDPDGQAWEDWSPTYAATYPDDARGKILQRYGDLVASLSHKPTADSVRVGFGMAYAAFHEFGAPANTMPRRGLLFSDPENGELGAADERAIVELVDDWLAGVFG